MKMNLIAAAGLFNVDAMKAPSKRRRSFAAPLSVLALVALGAIDVAAAPAAARTQAVREHAERQAIKNDLKRVQSDVAELIDSQNQLLRKLSDLETIAKTQAEEIRDLRSDLASERAKAASGYATVESVNTLTEKLRELDSKRNKDADLIVKELSRISKEYQTSLDQFDKRSELLNKRLSAVERGVATRPSSAPRNPTPEPPPSDLKGWKHTIQAGEFVGRVIAAYNEAWKAQGGKGTISLSSVKAANPGVNLDNVQVGQEIFLPQPGQ